MLSLSLVACSLALAGALEESFDMGIDGAHNISKPNMLVVYVDDLGYGDVGYNNGELAKATQHLNRLSASGIILDQFYTSPTCTASRSSLLTGRYPARLGLQDSVIHSTEPRGVPAAEVLLPSKLRDAGYQTLGFGKWHLGFHQTQYLPHKRGFDEFYGIFTGGGDHFEHTSTGSFVLRGPEFKETHYLFTGANMWHNDEHVPEDEIRGMHSTDIYAKKVMSFLSSDDAVSKPWFIYLAYQAVHAPMQASTEYVDGTIQNGCSGLQKKSSDRTFATMRRKLCGMMSMVDESTQKMVATLRKRDLWDSTLLVFLSDNGGIVRHGSSNAPLRGEKGEYYEGGIRVPAFFAGGFTEKELLRTDTAPYRSTALCHVTDIHATLLAVAGVMPNDEGELDGFSQWDALVANGKSARNDILHNVNSDLFGNAGAMRMGDYKLIVESRVSESEIYSYGQSMLQDSDWDMNELSQVIHQKLLRTPGSMFLFNIIKNPSEDESGGCSDVESCSNLYNLEAFAEIREEMLAKWREFVEGVPSSTEEWVDDGPLADPKHFGGYWTPWRDESGIPFATYSLAESTHHLTLMQHEPVPAQDQEVVAVPSKDDKSPEKLSEAPILKGTEDDQRRQLASMSTPTANMAQNMAFAMGGAVFGMLGAVFFLRRRGDKLGYL